MDDLDKITAFARQEQNEADGMGLYDVETKLELELYKRISSLASTVIVVADELRQTCTQLAVSKLDVEAWQKLQGLYQKTAQVEKEEIERLQEKVSDLAALLRRAQVFVRKDFILTANEEARLLSVEIGATLQPIENEADGNTQTPPNPSK